ncbi:MAG: tripartite tricarboxylate transporter permease [Gammaproteobacteria bacterium]
MLETIHAGFALFASWQNGLAIFGGLVFGVVIGAIPGMTGTMGVALALPFTFYMSPITGILLLVGIYKGAIYGGSIPAIVIKTPGTPAAACTVLDGYPMARKGQAGRALQMALYAGCTADVISNIALIFFAGFIASFALRFGPPEYFTLITFSLTIIAGVCGASLTRGLVSAGFGLLAATVGLDLVYGSSRLAFGSADLMGGFSFIPVLIGLFALPEIINEYTKHQKGREHSKVDRSSVTWSDYRKSFKTILRGSLIGVVLGAIPGIGAAPASFMSYSEAKRNSKDGDRFGEGEIEGVAAAESGANGVTGATLIPLLSLGVPGDVITAVILGAFMIHGLTPGPTLFQKHLTEIYAIFWGILFSSFLLFITGKVAIRAFARLGEVPNAILFPIVIVLCFFGTYAVNSSMFDVGIMVATGALGYFMLKFDVPPAPFLIAFILGPMFEDNLRRSLLLSKGSLGIFFSTPICWFFIILTVLSLALIVRRNVRTHLESRQRRRAEAKCGS